MYFERLARPLRMLTLLFVSSIAIADSHAPGQRMKVDTTLLKENAPTQSMKYTADKLIQHNDTNTVELIGNAKVTQGDQIVTGQKIVLNLKTGTAKVEGNGNFTASNMTVDLSSVRATKN